MFLSSAWVAKESLAKKVMFMPIYRVEEPRSPEHKNHGPILGIETNDIIIRCESYLQMRGVHLDCYLLTTRNTAWMLGPLHWVHR